MKKIYLLLVLLFTGLQSVFAQFIWHPDLGTPYAGAISLPWDTRSYMFQVDNGEEFGSPGDRPDGDPPGGGCLGPPVYALEDERDHDSETDL